MPNCDLCGKDVKLVKAEIEGTELNVCDKCSSFGKVRVISPATQEKIDFLKKRTIRAEPEEVLVTGFSELLRNKREKLGLSQEDFAQLLNEKESVVQKWENSLLKPKIEIARKLERILGLRLIEISEEKKALLGSGSAQEMTLGEMVKIKKRKGSEI